MLLITGLVIILILIIGLITFIIEEDKIKKSKVPKGTVSGYWKGQERRQSGRINTSLDVRYSVEKKNSITLNGQTKDISGEGVRLLVNEKLSEGTLLLLEIELPNTKDVVGAVGRVMWTNGKFDERDKNGKRIFHSGIQFVSIKSDDKNKLVAYMKKIEEKPENH